MSPVSNDAGVDRVVDNEVDDAVDETLDTERVQEVDTDVDRAVDAEVEEGVDAGRRVDANVLFDPADRASFEQRWTAVQTRFVDDPRDAVETADKLVAEVVATLTSRFADHKSALEEQWSAGSDRETEELRQALKGYRVFFHRLLAS